MITEATRTQLTELQAELTRRGIQLRGVTWNPDAAGEEHQERRAQEMIAFLKEYLNGGGEPVYFYTDPTGKENLFTGDELVVRLYKAEQELADLRDCL